MFFWFFVLLCLGFVQSYVRREIRTLTNDERTRFFDAVWELKRDHWANEHFGTYDDFIAHHAFSVTNETGDTGHFAPGFLWWHAVFLLEFERALQRIDPTITLPYWDWTIEGSMEHPEESILWEWFGNPTDNTSYVITTGAFANFPIGNFENLSPHYSHLNLSNEFGLMKSADNPNPATTLSRRVNNYRGDHWGVDGLIMYPTEYIDECMTRVSFNSFHSCIDDFIHFENSTDYGLHGTGHFIMGGSWLDDQNRTVLAEGSDFVISPTDPLFYLHHAQIDRLLWTWRMQYGEALATEDDPCGRYPKSQQRSSHNLNDQLSPTVFTFGCDANYVDAMNGACIPNTVKDICWNLLSSNSPYTYDTQAKSSFISESDKKISNAELYGSVFGGFAGGILISIFSMWIYSRTSSSRSKMSTLGKDNRAYGAVEEV